MHRPLFAFSILTFAVGCSDSAAPPRGDTALATDSSRLTLDSREAAKSAVAPAVNRHPPRFSPSQRPSGVPDDFVLTRNGFMHPSCVFSLAEDEVLDHDGAIRGPAGAVREIIPPCRYERYHKDGHLVTEGESSLPAHQPHAYDGWIAFYSYWGSLAAGSTLTTDWVIPASPTVNSSGLDIAFFNDIETATGGNDDILQPVLDYNSGVWTLESEHCCINGNDAYNGPGTALSVGDTIIGTVKGSNCSTDGSCSTWLVTTQDTTKNVTATLTVTNAAGAPMGVHPAVLETYGVTACNNLPASGKETFANNSLTDGNGKAQAVSYDFGSSPPSGYPACGYSGSISGNNYTLIFGKNVGGTSTGGAAGTGGNVATGGNRATGGNPATGGRSSTGGTASTGGSRTTGGQATTGGTTTTSSGTSTGGRANTGGAPATGGSATGTATATGGSATGGSKSIGGTTSVASLTGGAPVQATASGGAVANTGGRASSGGTAAINTSNNTGGSAASMGGSGTIATATAPLAGSSAVGGSSTSSSAPSNTSTDTGSCSCRVPGKRVTPSGLTSRAAILGLASLCVIRSRRRRRVSKPD